MHRKVNTVSKLFVCNQTIKSVIDAVRTETHEIDENCPVFLQCQLAKVQQTFCFHLEVARNSPHRYPKELHFIRWLFLMSSILKCSSFEGAFYFREYKRLAVVRPGE
jgi:hypothetical protein